MAIDHPPAGTVPTAPHLREADLPVAIVGAGFSGTLLAINLVRLGARVVLVERDEASLGKGIAYGTRRPEHLLNVRASNMSAFPDDAGHFLRWMGFAEAEQANRFVPRLAYGQYLREQLVGALSAAPDRLRIVQGEAVGVAVRGDGADLRMADDRTIAARAIVLALGNFTPARPAVLDGLPPAVLIADPWQGGGIETIARTGTSVLLIGTALTAIDVALALDSAGYRGTITALSRRGMVPQAHDREARPVGAVARPAARGSWLIRAVRARAALIGWRSAVDELRPHTASLWRLHDVAAQRRFLRHLRPFWDAHRHRIAPAVADRIAGLRAAGSLRFAAGRIVSAVPDGQGAAITWHPRGGAMAEGARYDFVINCTGPEGDIARIGEPLVRHLLAQGLIRPDVHRLGIDIDHLGRTVPRDGEERERIFAVGPLTKGQAWETVAVPDIRKQVWELARYLTSSHWIGEGL